MTSAVRRLVDPLIVAVITVFTALVSQRWAGLDTPDSSFYASLGIFGHDVTDRAVIPSYYSTRLGVIAPVRLLTSIFGDWDGLAAYRFVLIAVFVGSLYACMRLFASRPAAAVITTLLAMNTVVLAYFGNPYTTGTVLAGFALVISAGLRTGPLPSVAAGIGLGWLAMAHPPGAILAGSVWVALMIHARMTDAGLRPRLIGITALAGALTCGVFLGAGRLIFPGVNWLDTYLTWNAKLRYADFASDDAVWLRDISLLVPLLALVVAIGAWAVNRRERWAQLALTISATSIGTILVFSPVMGGVPLEAPMYQAEIWPAALVSLGLVAAGRIGFTAWPATAYLAAAVALGAVVAAGHWPGAMAFGAGLAVAAVAAGVLVLATRPGPGTAATVTVVILALGVTLTSAQLLQNSRRALGLYLLSPYSNAFNDNPVSVKLRTAVNAQQWLIANTESTDRILNWVDGDWVGGDRELYVVAAMQLWGENRVTLEKTPTADDIARLDVLRPSVVQMVGPTMDGILRFWSSLPANPTPPECYDFAWPNEAITVGHSCLTRLQW